MGFLPSFRGLLVVKVQRANDVLLDLLVDLTSSLVKSMAGDRCHVVSPLEVLACSKALSCCLWVLFRWDQLVLQRNGLAIK